MDIRHMHLLVNEKYCIWDLWWTSNVDFKCRQKKILYFKQQNMDKYEMILLKENLIKANSNTKTTLEKWKSKLFEKTRV